MNDKHTSDADDGSSDGPLAPSRRIVIKAAAALGLLGGFGAQTTAQDDGETTTQDGGTQTTAQNVAKRFELEGATGGWVGVAPEEIADQQNPTLQMEAGEDYEVFWENADGASHNFAIENEENDVLLATDYVSSIGETESVTFTAEENFDHYVCQPHRKTMRGQVTFGEVEETATTETGEETQQEEPAGEEERPREEPSTVFYLALEEGGWRGESPEAIAGQTNPTLNVEAGETYAIVWTLRTEREDHQTGHNLVIHDSDGRHLAYTEFVSEEGQSRTLVFTADEEMAYYSDQTQLGTNASIEVSGTSDGQTTTPGGETTAGGETTTDGGGDGG